jgi:hypothetical protein
MSEPNITWEELEPGVDRPAGTRHTFVVKRQLVTVIEVDDLSFHFNSAVMLPVAQIVDPGVSKTKPVFGLATIKAALQQAEGAGGFVLVAGHTDSVGSEAVNVVVSQHRADNVLAYLKGDKTGWVKSAEHHVVQDLQAILTWIARTFAIDCDPGGVDGKWGPNSRAALNRFRVRFNADHGGKLATSGPVSKKDWEAFYDMYELGLAREMKVEVAALAGKRGAVQFLDPPELACGEAWPIEAKHRDNVRSASNRRVEILFFEDSDVPDFQSEVPPGRSIYLNELRFHRVYIKIEGELQPFKLTLTLDGEALANAAFTLLVDGHTLIGTTDGSGLLEQEIPKAASSARIELKEHGLAFRLRLTTGLQDAEELTGVQRRLQNLAYYGGPLHGELDEATVASLKTFQREHDLQVTGEPDGPTKGKLGERFGS